VRQQWRIRAAGVLVLLTTVLFLPWMLTSLNPAARWLSWPFAGACLFSAAYALLNVFNGWTRAVPVHRLAVRGAEPPVGVIIPTCGESVPMVLRTIASVLDQDWPMRRLTLVVSDDGHDRELAAALDALPVLYHEPADRFSPGRDGAAKAGNLNDALAMLDRTHPEIEYIETRDADDEAGSARFLREVVGQLEADDRLAFVQTIKEAQVSAGDPFNNRESGFYRGQMLARNSANAVFPCGSGVVWRRTALRHIGEFPTWNLVEDLQSGVEALRRGWRGMYLPIVGAVGQHSPEDVPNVYKQRGTWAIDTVRLIVWRGLSGLRLRQRAHFIGMLMDYLNAFTVFVYVPAVICALLGVSPIVDSGSATSPTCSPSCWPPRSGCSSSTRPTTTGAATSGAPSGRCGRCGSCGRACPHLHQGHRPGAPRRTEPQARLQGDPQARRPQVALAAHPAADDAAADRGLRAALHRGERHPAPPHRPRRDRLLGRAQRHPAGGVRLPWMARPRPHRQDRRLGATSSDHVAADVIPTDDVTPTP
jgi:hypothetical protein